MNFHFRHVKRKKRTNAQNIAKTFRDPCSSELTHNTSSCCIKFVQVDVACTALQMRDCVKFYWNKHTNLKGFIFWLHSGFLCLLNIHIHRNLFLWLKRKQYKITVLSQTSKHSIWTVSNMICWSDNKAGFSKSAHSYVGFLFFKKKRKNYIEFVEWHCI